MGQEDNRFQPDGESSEEMLDRMRRLLGLSITPPRTDTYPVEVVLERLDLSSLDSTTSLFPQPVPPSTPNWDSMVARWRNTPPEQGSPRVSPDTSRRTEGQPNLTYFPLYPGLRMVWEAIVSNLNSDFVVRQPDSEGEGDKIFLHVTADTANKNPRFSAPTTRDLPRAMKIVAVHILDRAVIPEGTHPEVFDEALTSVEEKLYNIIPYLTYSAQGSKFEISAEDKKEYVFNALMGIAADLRKAMPRKQIIIDRALAADRQALGL